MNVKKKNELPPSRTCENSPPFLRSGYGTSYYKVRRVGVCSGVLRFAKQK